MIPLDVSLNVSYVWLTIINYLLDVFFLIDLILNFFTMQRDSKTNELIRKKRIICQNYVFKGWFWIDTLSIIPFEIISILLGNSSLNLRFFKMLKMIRLLRLTKIINYLKTNKKVKFGLLVCQVFLFLFFSYHWIGTMWFFIADWENLWIPPKDTDTVDY